MTCPLRVRHLRLAAAAVIVATTVASLAVPVSAGSAWLISTYAGSAIGSSGSTGDGGAATAAYFSHPGNVAVDSSGDTYVADILNNRIQFIPNVTGTHFGVAMTANDIYTIAGSATGVSGSTGDGGLASLSLLGGPTGVSVDSFDNVYIADYQNDRVQFIPHTSGSYFGVVMTANDIYTIAGTTGVPGLTGDGGSATAALLYYPSDVATDSSGNVYIADQQNARIQFVPTTSGTYFGVSMTANDMYTIAGSATGAVGSSGDGGLAIAALLATPWSIALDSSGIFIADENNDRIQFVPTTTGTYFGVSMTANDIYTIAGTTGSPGLVGDGGLATSSQLQFPRGVAFDSAGDLYIADTTNNRIQFLPTTSGTYFGVVMTANDIYTIAGSATGVPGLTGDGGSATTALLSLPYGVAVGTSDNYYIADHNNNRIQEVYGQYTLPATFIISSGSLAFVSAPGSVTFTPLTLSGVNQTSSASQALDISDASGSGNGWNVTISATQFTAGSQTLPYADFSVLSAPGVACDVSSGCAQATLGAIYPYTLSSATTKLVSVAALTGMGDQTITIPWTANILKFRPFAGCLSRLTRWRA